MQSTWRDHQAWLALSTSSRSDERAGDVVSLNWGLVCHLPSCLRQASNERRYRCGPGRQRTARYWGNAWWSWSCVGGSSWQLRICLSVCSCLSVSHSLSLTLSLSLSWFLWLSIPKVSVGLSTSSLQSGLARDHFSSMPRMWNSSFSRTTPVNPQIKTNVFFINIWHWLMIERKWTTCKLTGWGLGEQWPLAQESCNI